MRLSYTPPPGWDFATVGDLAKPEKGSIRIGPFGSALKKHEYCRRTGFVFLVLRMCIRTNSCRTGASTSPMPNFVSSDSTR